MSNKKFRCIILGCAAISFIYVVSTSPGAWAETVAEPPNPSAECLECHGEASFATERDGKPISLFVDEKIFKQSSHYKIGCTDCHFEHGGEDLEHTGQVEKVDCSKCHEKVAGIYSASLHGKAVKDGAKLAPRCWDCHKVHEIVSVKSPDSNVAKLNIPFVCGRCHKEGTEVTQTYDIPQDNILTHYSLSIHGEGLFKQGLTVTAVCIDCHSSHNILPHTDPGSTIFRDNVPKTCQKCHGLIEQVHRKVIRGELWEKEPNKVPICVDCHSPHKARKVYYELGMSDRDCLMCHERPDIATVREGQAISLTMDTTELQNSAHHNVACAQCHTGASVEHKRPCATITSKVDCSICHAEVVETYSTSTHGMLADRGDRNAPKCTDCHGTHGVKDRLDPKSPTFPMNVPALCSQCHQEGNPAAVKYKGTQHNIVQNYKMSIHGKGLLESGLVVTAMCTDCHTAHHVLPSDNPVSSVNENNIAETCSKCHSGIYEQFTKSIHSTAVSKTDEPLPMCHDCHSSHTISRTDEEGFMLDIAKKCGNCHEDVTESYFKTYHGKVSKLGYTATAKCYDCHGAHNILPPYDPKSNLSRQNVVKTCAKCHPGSHRRFAGYLTHATHHDRKKYPALFYTFWFMTLLLLGTFTFFGIHALLWFPRSYQTMKERKNLRRERESQELEYQRFGGLERRLHFFMVISFLGLALTGMTLKFSYLVWAQWLSRILGGFESAGYIHRFCALIMIGVFSTHMFDMIRRKWRGGKTWMQFIFGPDSMVPNINDLREFVATFKWFIGLGPRPEYGRWTYWEKFDYFAVFWGVAIIGSTGLFLWFPEYFTYVLPGWLINVATIIHSDEALLAVGFIFTIHFFNTHFRPDKFPMDTVIFTGSVPLEELKHDRPQEYKKLVESGELEKHLVEPLPPVVVRGMKIFGAVALSTGLLLILLIIWAEVFGYR